MKFEKRDAPQKGDLLRVHRKKGYYHFGVASSESTVIHFTGKEDDSITDFKKVAIRETPLSTFIKKDKLQVLTPFCSPFSRDEVVERAKSFVGSHKFRDKYYNFITNNCEHFARYIYFDKAESVQVIRGIQVASSFVVSAEAVIATTAVVKTIQKKQAKKKASNN